MTDKKQIVSLRSQIKTFIKEALDGGPLPTEDAPSKATDGPEQHVTAGGIMVTNKPDMSLQATIVEIAKSAAYGLERVELLKKRSFPTHKSADAVGTAVDALGMIFKDMLRNPMNYLDEDPVEQVADYEKSLDAEMAKLDK